MHHSGLTRVLGIEVILSFKTTKVVIQIDNSGGIITHMYLSKSAQTLHTNHSVTLHYKH